jgi:hypothetical protein
VHVRAEVLVQALPHMQRYDEEVVVIKYGGHATSVTRRPSRNSDLMPSRSSMRPICGPPPWTTTGLVQALPHMQRYDEEVVVIKYGGHAMGDRAAAEDFARAACPLRNRSSRRVSSR